jgi:hypothetical protein
VGNTHRGLAGALDPERGSTKDLVEETQVRPTADIRFRDAAFGGNASASYSSPGSGGGGPTPSDVGRLLARQTAEQRSQILELLREEASYHGQTLGGDSHAAREGWVRNWWPESWLDPSRTHTSWNSQDWNEDEDEGEEVDLPSWNWKATAVDTAQADNAVPTEQASAPRTQWPQPPIPAHLLGHLGPFHSHTVTAPARDRGPWSRMTDAIPKDWSPWKASVVRADIPQVTQEVTTDDEARLAPGGVVYVHGLPAESGLNGQKGELVGLQGDTGRWRVILEDDRGIAAFPEHLFPRGSLGDGSGWWLHASRATTTKEDYKASLPDRLATDQLGRVCDVDVKGDDHIILDAGRGIRLRLNVDAGIHPQDLVRLERGDLVQDVMILGGNLVQGLPLAKLPYRLTEPEHKVDKVSQSDGDDDDASCEVEEEAAASGSWPAWHEVADTEAEGSVQAVPAQHAAQPPSSLKSQEHPSPEAAAPAPASLAGAAVVSETTTSTPGVEAGEDQHDSTNGEVDFHTGATPPANTQTGEDAEDNGSSGYESADSGNGTTRTAGAEAGPVRAVPTEAEAPPPLLQRSRDCPSPVGVTHAPTTQTGLTEVGTAPAPGPQTGAAVVREANEAKEKKHQDALVVETMRKAAKCALDVAAEEDTAADSIVNAQATASSTAQTTPARAASSSVVDDPNSTETWQEWEAKSQRDKAFSDAAIARENAADALQGGGRTRLPSFKQRSSTACVGIAEGRAATSDGQAASSDGYSFASTVHNSVHNSPHVSPAPPHPGPGVGRVGECVEGPPREGCLRTPPLCPQGRWGQKAQSFRERQGRRFFRPQS